MGVPLAPAGGARGRALSWAAQRTWLGILAGRRLAHRPARTPPGCGLAKSAFIFGRFARFFDALRSLRGLNRSVVGPTDPEMMFSLFLLASVVPTGQSFTCTPVAVWDGDGPDLVRGRSACSPFRGRRTRNEWQLQSRASLSGRRSGRGCAIISSACSGTPQGRNRTGHILVRGPVMRCLSRGGAGGTRTAAFCTSPRSGDISCAMIRSGPSRRAGTKYWGAHRCD